MPADPPAETLPPRAGPGSDPLATLPRIVARITASLDPQETYQATLDAVRETFPADVGSLRLYHEASRELILAAWAGLSDEEAGLLSPRVPLDGESISARVARARTSLCLARPEELEAHAPPWIRTRLGVASILCVPLLVQDRLLGTLLIGARRPQALGPADLDLAGAIAQVVAPALDRVVIHAKTVQARARAEALAAVGQAISTSLDLDEVLGLLVERTAKATGADAVAVWERHGGTGALRCRRTSGLSPRYQRDFRLPAGAGVSGAAIASGAPQSTRQILSDPRYPSPEDTRALIAAEGIQGILSVPVRGEEGPYGVLNLYWREPRVFAEDETAFVAQIADQAAIAIQNARLYGQARDRLETIRRQHAGARALLEVSQALTQTLDLELVFDLIAEKVLAVTGADACGIARTAPSGDLEYVRATGFIAPNLLHMTLRRGEGLMGRCLEAGTPVWSYDLQADPAVTFRPDRRARVQMRGGLAVPIVTADGPYGVLFIGRRGPHEHSPDEIAFAEALAAQAALAIQNARLYQEERARTQDLAAIIRTGRTVASSLDLDQILKSIAASAVELSAARLARLHLLEGGQLVLRACAGPLQAEFEGALGSAPIPMGESFSGQVAAHGRALWVPDIAADPREIYGEFSARQGLRTYLGVPILAGDRVLGVLSVLGGADVSVTEAREEVLASLAAQAAIAIENARLYEAMRLREAHLRALLETNKKIGAPASLDALLASIAEEAARFLGVEGAGFRLVEGEELALAGAWGDAREAMVLPRIPRDRSLSGWVVTHGQPLVLSDMLEDPRILPEHREAARRLGHTAFLGVPLTVGGRVTGVLSIRRKGQGGFTDQDVQMATAFADQAAIAIENARLYAEAQEGLAELAAIHEASQGIAQSLDLQETLQHILAATMRLTDMDKGIIWLLDEGRGELLGTVVAGLSGELTVRLPLAERSFAAACLRERQTLVSESPEDDPRCHSVLQARFGNKALIAVPLRSGDRIIGVLDLGDLRRRRRFGAREIAIVERLAQQAVVAIENARLFQQEQERRRQIEAVRAVTEEITRELDLPTLLRLINWRAAELVGGASGVVYLWDEGTQELVPGAWSGLGDWVREARLRLGEGLTGMVAQRREGLIVNDYRNWPAAAAAVLQHTAVTAGIGEPLLYRDRLLGAIIINQDEGGRRFTERDREVLATFAAQAAIAIENARLYAETRKAYEDLRATQEQLVQAEKLKALGEMAGGVAHDFNNLLTAVLGQAQLLRLRASDPHLREGLGVIERAALDGAETVRRILGFARVRGEADYAPVDVAALFSQVLEVTRPRWKDEAQGRGTAIEADLALEPVPPARGNAAELREVLVNLVFNAVDAMPRGGRLTLGARRLTRAAATPGGLHPHRQVLADQADAAQEVVEIFVRDTGVGMPEEVRRRAFDPFFTTKGVKGTGLGLSVVYGIIARHGGEVLLESQEGMGTTVILRLPAAPAGPAAGREAGPPLAARPGRIVVLDDEEALALVLADILRLQRHQVEAFTDPRRALEHLSHEPADLFFTDLGMPEMSGWDVARAARALRPDLPVVLVTGWGHQIDPAEVQARRITAVVAKPYKLEDILRAVATILPPAPS